jgi:hypothetical protein
MTTLYEPHLNPRDPKFAGPCSRCGRGVPNDAHRGEYPGALSRLDNATYICSDCGMDEALYQLRNSGHLPPLDQAAVSTADVQTKACVVCGRCGVVRMPYEAFLKWERGAFIQVAWPEGPAELREQLVSGTHPKCWEQLVGPEED